VSCLTLGWENFELLDKKGWDKALWGAVGVEKMVVILWNGLVFNFATPKRLATRSLKNWENSSPTATLSRRIHEGVDSGAAARDGTAQTTLKKTTALPKFPNLFLHPTTIQKKP